jgi:ubiquinone/menaquinone biosynthesis C-methylase UbiE
MVLTRAQARAFYDRFGAKQDSQSFYEDPALDDLIAHADFGRARGVFELACGTGRLADRLLSGPLPPEATYLGVDLSATMVSLARARLSRHDGRARVVQTDGEMRFPATDGAMDRVVATYVLDLLSEDDIRAALAESRRVLASGGKLCLASLTEGTTLASRALIAIWKTLYFFFPSLVGGCRPVRLEPFLDPAEWTVEYRRAVVAFGVPSEVVVASPKP